jgi:hypothetical protein
MDVFVDMDVLAYMDVLVDMDAFADMDVLVEFFWGPEEIFWNTEEPKTDQNHPNGPRNIKKINTGFAENQSQNNPNGLWASEKLLWRAEDIFWRPEELFWSTEKFKTWQQQPNGPRNIRKSIKGFPDNRSQKQSKLTLGFGCFSGAQKTVLFVGPRKALLGAGKVLLGPRRALLTPRRALLMFRRALLKLRKTQNGPKPSKRIQKYQKH